MTLLQAAEKLHVDAKVLESLEAERFDLLGAPVFVRGHLRHYAELIGEQAAPLLDLYAASTKPVAPDLTRVPKAPPASDPRKLAVPALIVLIGFALVGIVWWALQGLTGPAQPGSPGDAHTVSADPETESSMARTSSVELQSQASVPAQSARVTVAANTPSQAATASAAGTAAGTSAGATAAAPTAGRTIDVTLRFAADSWAEVYDANGERLFYDIGLAESSRTVSGKPPLRVVLGNAPGVSVDVNGKPAEVPANAVSNDTAQFVINRSGRIVRSRPGDGG